MREFKYPSLGVLPPSFRLIKTIAVLFCVSALFLSLSEKAHAATYYVRADGTVTAANKANATSPGAAGTSLNLAQAKAAAFAAGDQVLFSSQGGTYAEALVLPSGGTGVGTEITYANVPTETPLISTATSPVINTNAKSHIKVIGLSVNYTGIDVWSNGVLIGAGSNISLQSLTINMNSYGIGIISSAAISDVLIDAVTITNFLKYGVYLFGVGNDITVSNSTVTPPPAVYTSRSIQISTATNVTVSDIIATSSVMFATVTTGVISNVTAASTLVNDSPALILNSASGITVSDFSFTGLSDPMNIYGTSNNITIDRFTASGGGKWAKIYDTANTITINDSALSNTQGFWVLAGTGSPHDITFNRVTSSNGALNGFLVQGSSYNITFNNCVADYNNNNGFATTETPDSITFNYCEASYNGAIDATFDGTGFVPHLGGTNIRTNYCIAHHNFNSGIGAVGTGTGAYYNIVNWANGYAIGDTYKGGTVSTAATRGNMYFGMGAGSYVVDNVISGGGGKPRELISNDFTAFDYNIYQPLDVAKFWSLTVDGFTSWATYHATKEANSQNIDPQFVDAASANFALQSTSPAIDAGTDVSLSTDYLGNPIYGSPDIGAFEYQPPHTLTGTTIDAIDIGAGARVYANGRFRDLGTRSARPAHLKVVPQSGSFALYNATTVRPAWLDITDISLWNNDHKIWTESNAQSSSMVTNHIVGDLDSNMSYIITVTGAAASTISGINGTSCTTATGEAVCTSDAAGTLSFAYDGGYSTHTFEMTEIPSPSAVTVEQSSSPPTSGGRRGTREVVRKPRASPSVTEPSSTHPVAKPATTPAQQSLQRALERRKARQKSLPTSSSGSRSSQNPPASPLPLQNNSLYRIRVPILNLRADSRLTAVVRGTLPRGLQLTVLSFVQGNQWALVRLPDGREGYVYASSLEQVKP